MNLQDLTIYTVLILILLSIAGTIISIVYIIRNKDSIKITYKSFLKIYILIISIITLFTFSISLAQVIKAGFSYVAGYQFSYPIYSIENFAPPKTVDGESTPVIDEKVYNAYPDEIEYAGEKYGANFSERRTDLVNGIVFAVVSLFLFTLHRFLLKMFKDSSDLGEVDFLNKIYNFANLLLYGILSILVIPQAIYSTVNYFLFDWANGDVYSRAIPGAMIASVLIIMPFWIWFLVKAIKTK